MRRFVAVLFFAWMGVLPLQALPPLSFGEFSAMTYNALDPYITDYFKRYPEQKGSEVIIRKFFQEHPPDVLMPELKKSTPLFYEGIKSKAAAAQAGEKGSKYTLEDFMNLPTAEHRELARLTGPYLHALLTNPESKDGLQEMLAKENRALEMIFMLVQMRAQQSTAETFSDDLSQIMSGLAQMRQTTEKKN